LLLLGLVAGILPCKAITAVDGPVTTGLERHLGGSATAIANYFIHLAIAAASAPAITIAFVGPAGRAAAWLVCEALLGKESLFRAREYEFGTAITASKGFVCVHG